MTPSDQLENLISEALSDRAAQAADGENLMRDARRRGRRIVLRRRIVAGVACAAVLAVAVPVGINVLGPETQKIEPIETSTPLPRRTLPAKVTKVILDIDKLPKGKTPGVPYYADGAIHDGGRTVEVPGTQPDSFVNFVPVAGGYAVQIGDGPDGRSMLLSSSGAKIRDLPVLSAHVSQILPTVSPDGRSLAWPEWDAGDSGNGVMVVADSTTGEVRYRMRVDGAQFPYPVGFVGAQVVLTDDYGGYVRLWEPESGKLTPVPGVTYAHNTDGSELLVAPMDGDLDKYEVVNARTGTRPWQSKAGFHGLQLLRGAPYAYVQERKGEGERPQDNVMTVFDAQTGRRLLELTGYVDQGTAAEADGSVLISAVSNDRERGALVRCTLDGKCELATEPKGLENGFAWHLAWPR
jgi:hypothetical protein